MANVDPHNYLAQVHQDLARVIRATSQFQPFVVVYGIRTLEAEEEAVATGHSQTLHSRHLPQPHYHDLSCAIDFCVLASDGVSLDWTVADEDGGKFGVVAQHIQVAADALGVKIQWGGAKVGAWVDGQVSHFRDWGHIQLDPSAYP